MVDDAREIILAAFNAARRSGKAEWYRMTSAVLKNRILDLSGRSFDESEYGAQSFTQFVGMYPDLIIVDTSTFPSTVELKDRALIHESTESDQSATFKQVVRPDLWRAILDYVGGDTYVWDLESNQAHAGEPTPTCPQLPTVTADEMSGWRSQFADKHRDKLAQSPTQFMLLEAWRSRGLGTKFLPPLLQGPWNGFLRESVIGRLHAWFKEHKLEPPVDLDRTVERHSPDRADGTGLERLRALIVQCVEVMTESELVDLKLPPRAVLRVRARKGN